MNRRRFVQGAIQNGFTYAICDAAKQDALLPGKSSF